MKETLLQTHKSDDAIVDVTEPDVFIVTSGGRRIPVARRVLASASPVLESLIDYRRSDNTIPIPGVPCDAVSVFLDFLSSSNCGEEQMKKYGVHLLVLSHVYIVPQLKRRCAKSLGERLTTENVVDVLQLARLCDAPDLYIKCMKLISTHFKSVELTEGWGFVQNHDPWLELEILQFIDDTEKRKKKTKKHRQDQGLYSQLSEAMECLEHICKEGCTKVGPYNMTRGINKKKPCSRFATCEGLQLLVKHFATCKKRPNGGCLKCKRMWQLLMLHSSICEQPDACGVPLCRHFKLKVQQERKGDGDARWRLLVRKVVSAKVMSSLAPSKGGN